MGQEAYEIYISDFWKKKTLLRVKGLSWAQKCFVLKTQDMLWKIFL